MEWSRDLYEGKAHLTAVEMRRVEEGLHGGPIGPAPTGGCAGHAGGDERRSTVATAAIPTIQTKPPNTLTLLPRRGRSYLDLGNRPRGPRRWLPHQGVGASAGRRLGPRPLRARVPRGDLDGAPPRGPCFSALEPGRVLARPGGAT
ncbi:hypothetical protein GCM10010256_50090 [Streptomyces coeruleorubidus]|nr:hypothetical protein GCM10010256_50090 [Streptomyces coeruleorubidus]